MSTSDIIATTSTIIAAGSLIVTFLQYRASRIKNQTETSWKAEQHKILDQLASRARAQAETAKIIFNRVTSGAEVDIEDLQALSAASGKLSTDLATQAEYTRPVPARQKYSISR